MKAIKEYTNIITKLILLLLLGASSLTLWADDVDNLISKAVAGDKHAIQQLEDVARKNKHKGLNGILAIIYERGLGGNTSTDYQKAEEFYTKHLQESPDEATEIYNKLGDMYSRVADEQKKAKYYYAKAMEKNPNDPKAYGRLGMLYAYGAGKLDYEKAKQFFEKAIALNTDNTNVYDGLALIYGGMGGTIPTDVKDSKRALELFKKSCQMGSEKGCDMLNKIKNELESKLNK